MKNKILYLLIGLILSVTLPVIATSTDPLILRRIRLLEQRLNELKEDNDGSSQMPGYEPVKESNLPTANLLSRVTNLEESVRAVTGKQEEIYHQLTQLRHQLEILIGDMEVRFKESEAAIKTLIDYSTAKDKTTTAQDPNPSRTLSKKDKGEVVKENSEKVPSKDKIKQQYLEAKAYFDAGNFIEAENAFRNFTEHNKKNEYSASAAFWLGKTYLKLGQPKKAAVAFKTGYTQHSQSRRTAENLLGVAEALAKTNRKNACVTLEALQQELPNRELMDKDQINNVQTKTAQLYKQLNCDG